MLSPRKARATTDPVVVGLGRIFALLGICLLAVAVIVALVFFVFRGP